MAQGDGIFDTQRDTPAGSADFDRDEIDHELLSNAGQGAAPHSLLTNSFNDTPFDGANGAPVTVTNPTLAADFDLTEFHDYRIDWLTNRVVYYVDGALVRTETSLVPDDPMRAHFNLWRLRQRQSGRRK